MDLSSFWLLANKILYVYNISFEVPCKEMETIQVRVKTNQYKLRSSYDEMKLREVCIT